MGKTYTGTGYLMGRLISVNSNFPEVVTIEDALS